MVLVVIALSAVVSAQAAAAAEAIRVSVTLPPGAAGGGLDAVSCPASGDCVAVGGYTPEGKSTGEDDPMVVSETGGLWGQAVAVAPLGNPATAFFEGVGCDAPGSCVAVGFEGSAGAGPKHPIAATETNGAWGPAFSIAPPAGETISILFGVSCPAAGSCVAVGGDQTGPFGVVESGGTWGEAVQITPPPGATGHPVGTTNIFNYLGVGCAAVGSCVGVGEGFDGENHREATAATETSGTWARSVLIGPPSAPGPAGYALDGVSCPAVGSCVAVGENASTPFVATETGGVWGQSTAVPLPDGSSTGTLHGISCPATGSCLAVGISSTGEGGAVPTMATEAGGIWTSTGLAAPAGSVFALLSGVSCPAGGDCASVGGAFLGSGAEEPLIYSGGGPGMPTVPTAGPVAAPISRGGGPSAAPSCAISVGGTAIPVTKAHAARVGLIDTGGGTCNGTASLMVKVRGKGKKAKSKRVKLRKIGIAPLRLEAGKKTVVDIRLNGAGRAALSKAHGHVKAKLAVRAPGVQITKSVRLREARKKRHRGS